VFCSLHYRHPVSLKLLSISISAPHTQPFYWCINLTEQNVAFTYQKAITMLYIHMRKYKTWQSLIPLYFSYKNWQSIITLLLYFSYKTEQSLIPLYFSYKTGQSLITTVFLIQSTAITDSSVFLI
jgi:hypothetical protein